MKIHVGSKNVSKVGAVERVVKRYQMFEGAEVVGVEVPVDQFGHPKSLEETVAGAIARAKAAFAGADFGFGLEGGLLAVPHSKTGYMEIAVCAIYGGEKIHLGLSPAFEWPKGVTEKILHGGLDASQAVKALKFTEHEKLGNTEGGIIGMLTGGRLTRTNQNEAAVIMALVHLEHPHLY